MVVYALRLLRKYNSRVIQVQSQSNLFYGTLQNQVKCHLSVYEITVNVLRNTKNTIIEQSPLDFIDDVWA